MSQQCCRPTFKWQYLLQFQRLANALDMGLLSEADMTHSLCMFEQFGCRGHRRASARACRKRFKVASTHVALQSRVRLYGGGSEDAVEQPQPMTPPSNQSLSVSSPQEQWLAASPAVTPPSKPSLAVSSPQEQSFAASPAATLPSKQCFANSPLSHQLVPVSWGASPPGKQSMAASPSNQQLVVYSPSVRSSPGSGRKPQPTLFSAWGKDGPQLSTHRSPEWLLQSQKWQQEQTTRDSLILEAKSSVAGSLVQAAMFKPHSGGNKGGRPKTGSTTGVAVGLTSNRRELGAAVLRRYPPVLRRDPPLLLLLFCWCCCC